MTDLRPSLQPSDYVDPAVYADEVDHVLRSSWLPVADFQRWISARLN